MGKLIPLLFAGAGASAVSVGGVYLLNSRSRSADLGFKTLADFKTQNGGSFTQEFFGQVSFDTAASSGNPVQVDSSSNKVEASYFDGETGDAQSSLVVNWERHNPTPQTTDQKWLGDFAALWNVTKGNKGFTVFLAAHPGSEEKKLSLEGGIYFLEKTGTPETWSVKKYKELSSQTMGKDDFDSKFPKAKDSVKTSISGVEVNSEPFWGFVTSKESLEKSASSTTSGTSTSKSNHRHWSAQWRWQPKSGGAVMSDWSDNFQTWSETLFTKGEVALKDLVDKLKGSWVRA